MTAPLRFVPLALLLAPLALALTGQDKPPAPAPAPVPPAVTTPAPAPPAAPDDVLPVAGAPARVPYEFLHVDLPARGAMAALRKYGADGWQFGQLENYLEETVDDRGVVHQSQMVRLILQRPVLPAGANP